MFAVEGVADPRGLDGAALTALFESLDAQRRRVEAALVAVIGEAERCGVFRDDGHATVAGWCRATGRWSHAETTRRHQVARLAAASDDVASALAAGQVGVAQAHELGRAFANPRCGDQLPDIAKVMLDHAERLAHRDFKLVVDRWVLLADADGAHRDADWTHDHREASIVEHDGGFSLHANGGAVAGAEMNEVLARFCDAEFAADWDETVARHGDGACADLMPRTDRQRRFDALAAIFRRAAGRPPDATTADPVVNVVVDIHTLDLLLHDHPVLPVPADPRARCCETADGALVVPGDVLAALWWGHIRRVVVDCAGVVVDMGRRKRLFTAAVRDAVLLQSRRCVWPGCQQASGRCQADHLTEWHRDGPTATTNGAPLCGRHNRWKTRGYTTWRDHDGYWHTRRPDGTEI